MKKLLLLTILISITLIGCTPNEDNTEDDPVILDCESAPTQEGCNGIPCSHGLIYIDEQCIEPITADDCEVWELFDGEVCRNYTEDDCKVYETFQSGRCFTTTEDDCNPTTETFDGQQCVPIPPPTCDRGYEEMDGTCERASVKRYGDCPIGYEADGSSCIRLENTPTSLGYKTTILSGGNYSTLKRSIEVVTFSNTEHQSYVELNQFFDFLGTSVHGSYMIEDGYYIWGTKFIDEIIQMKIDEVNNTIEVSHIDIFDYMNGDIEGDPYSGHLSFIDYTEPENTTYTYDLDQYGIDIITFNDKFYVPLYIANMFFTGPMISVFETETHVVAYEVDVRPELLYTMTKYMNPYAEMHIIAQDTESFLTILLNEFHGLHTQGIDLSDEVIDSFGISEATTQDELNKRVEELFLYLDDNHTALISGALGDPEYESAVTADPDSRIGVLEGEYNRRVCDARENQYEVYIEGDIKYIQLNGFDEDIFSVYSHFHNTSKQSTVVIDLTCNTGGTLIHTLEIIAAMAKENVSVNFYYPDVDETFTLTYNGITPAENTYYILTSEVTYSAGNLFAVLAKSYNLGTLIGTKTGGGASPIALSSLPSGNSFVYSSNYYLISNLGNNIENGIIPEVIYDIEFDPETLRAKLFGLDDFINYEILFNQTGTELQLEYHELSIKDIPITYSIEVVHENNILYNPINVQYVENFIFTNTSLEDYDYLEVTMYAHITLNNTVVTIPVFHKYYDTNSDNFTNEATLISDINSVDAISYFPEDNDVFRIEVSSDGLYQLQNTLGEVPTFDLFDVNGQFIESNIIFNLSVGTYYIRATDPINTNTELTISKVTQ